MSKKIWGLRLASSLSALLIAGGLSSASYTNFQVQGNSRIDDDVVLGVAGLTPGQAYSDTQINQALQRLYGSGLFDSVVIEPTGTTIVINVVENASVGRVFFEGNTNIKDEVLASIVKIGPRDGLDRKKIQEDAQEIRRLYASRSRFDVKIEPVIIPVADGVFNVVYEIDEGTVADVNRVSFTGNDNVSDWRLRRTIDTGETSLFASFFSRDNFAQEKLVSDQAKLLEYYQNHGYYNADVRAVNADYSAIGNYYVSYAIKEGQRFQLGDVRFKSSIPGVSADRFLKLNKVYKGKIYRIQDVRDTIEAIETQAEFEGLPFLRVRPVITPNEANGTLDVVFEFVQGDRNYVDRIDIHGNETTMDRVIRRQFDTVEGDPVNPRKLTDARRRLEGLGFFERVAVTTRETSAIGRQIIDVDVAEAPTGNLNFGAGYSDNDGVSAFAELSERNFMGRGQYVSARVDWGQNSQSVSLGFTEPGLFERDLAVGFDAYYRDVDRPESAYQMTSIGFEPRVSFPVTDNSRLSLGYFIRNNELRDVLDTTSPLIAKEEGDVLTSGVSATYALNRLNSNINPTEGWIMRLGASYAGLGGDADWYQLGAKARAYYPLWDEDVIFSAEVEGGMIETLSDTPVRINERYFLGSDSFLGFRSGGLGPRDFDSASGVNSSLGGNYYGILRTELSFPLGLPEELGLHGAIFYQAGSVWGLDEVTGAAMGTVDDDQYLRQSRGVSILWNLGGQNLRFSWIDPFDAQEYDRTDDFTVSLSTKF